jgi:hypothetical protein
VIPALAHIDAEWEHMTRCIVEGLRLVVPEMTYEASLMYLCWVLDIQTPSLSAAITTQHHIRFKLMRFMMTRIMHLPGQRRFSVWLMRRRMNKASEASDKWMEIAKAKAESYLYTIKVRDV